ncbi:hypothetical protein [Kyrpidia sp.]|uniref:hypothetical protein n=1 Tax=Kyrpidia sp. TaxID=2073077 RepID=UPI002589D2C8|nr:hypothetical protein [Kyrpidia sp.]MCL6575119.1 hypothetical protein [Kyrpidia sp.]
MNDDLTRKLEQMAEDARKTVFRGWGVSEDLIERTLARVEARNRRRSRWAARWLLGVASVLLALAGVGATTLSVLRQPFGRDVGRPAIESVATPPAGAGGANQTEERVNSEPAATTAAVDIAPPQPHAAIDPAVLPVARDVVSRSLVPVVLPGVVPRPAVPGLTGSEGRVKVTDQILESGYLVEAGWLNGGEPDSTPISEANRLVSFGGTRRDAAPTTFLDTVRDRLAAVDPVVLDGGFPARRLVLKDTGGDVVTWSAGGWTYVTAGLFRGRPGDVAVTEASRLAKDLASGAPVAPGAAQGMIQVLDLGNRPTVEVNWTYGGKVWYSVSGISVAEVLSVARSMRPVPPASAPRMKVPFVEEWKDLSRQPGPPALFSPPAPAVRLSQGVAADRQWLASHGVHLGAWAREDHTGSRLYVTGAMVADVTFERGTLVVAVTKTPHGEGAESVIWSNYWVPVTQSIRVVDDAGRVLVEIPVSP